MAGHNLERSRRMGMKSHWITRTKMPRFGKVTRDVKADVVIIGGGITGITAAYLLKKAGRSVALLERDRCALVDTGHTTAHLTYVTDARLSELVKTFGKDHAQAVWDAGQAALAQIDTLVNEEQIDCGFGRVPGYLNAPWQKDVDKAEIERLKEDADLAAEMGFDSHFLESVPLAKRPGVRFANQAKFHPLRYLAGLLPRIARDGSHIFENSEVTEFQNEPLGVKVNGHVVRCDYLVIATHVPLMGLTGLVSATLFQTKLASYSSYAVGAKAPKGSLPEAIFSDTDDPYHYLRIDRLPRHDYAIFGGEDHKTGQEADSEACVKRLKETLSSIVPTAKVDASWTGQVIETPDGLPYIGEIVERQFVATGFAGNGMTFGTLGGMMAVDAVLGKKNPWRDLFDVNRKKLSSAWDYLKENVDYPYYYLKGKLAAAEGSKREDVERGEGKILKVDGQRVAAYRDQHGKMTMLSPVCTHMGCIVHWNQADSTWDCPCHGSRFQATGEILAGPAETPLEEISVAKVKG
jgi:glycine/D-amino acid oxidase-like deaminating enzyme/nitrite reductase/ring-hydroxylating ferredoxin subunit